MSTVPPSGQFVLQVDPIVISDGRRPQGATLQYGESMTSSGSPAPTSPRTAGRPRDPTLEDRAYRCAVALYEEYGWAGFSYEAVAARAGIGKSALYRRWPAKEDLLAEALQARTSEITRIDTGALRGDLIQLGEQLLANYTAPHGLVSLRLFVEAPHHPELEARTRPRLEAQQRESREIVERAVGRGELPRECPHDEIVPAVSGGILHKVLTTRGASRAELRRNRRNHAERLVDFVLAAASVPSPPSGQL